MYQYWPVDVTSAPAVPMRGEAVRVVEGTSRSVAGLQVPASLQQDSPPPGGTVRERQDSQVLSACLLTL